LQHISASHGGQCITAKSGRAWGSPNTLTSQRPAVNIGVLFEDGEK
jgi:hypothetical protein